MLKRIALEKYWKQLQEIKEAQAKKDFLPFLFITVEPDGAITIGVGADQRRFETLFDVEAYLWVFPVLPLKRL